MEKYNLLVLMADSSSEILDRNGRWFSKIKQYYAHENATLMLIFIGKNANRIIAGQQIGDVEALPVFDDSEGRADVSFSIQNWIYEARMNMYSGSFSKTRTAVIADVSDELLVAHSINPIEILSGAEDTDYYFKTEHCGRNLFAQAKVSTIEKLTARANAGDDKAQYMLGHAYYYGEGVEKNIIEAQIYFDRAYLRGNTEALFALVDLFENPGEGLCEKAAKLRDSL